ncbi:hypothetical protein HRbin36_00022 [bacterium HR36]|nr:hypothetical protein HRbin36_00022 [bacterium HR36]
MALARWITSIIIFLLILVVGWYALWFRPQQNPPATLSSVPTNWHGLLGPPAPAWIPFGWLENVVREAGLPPAPPTDAEQLAHSLEVLTRKLRANPCIKEVTLQAASAKPLLIKWVRVVPILFISDDSNVVTNIWLASEDGVWLLQLRPFSSLEGLDGLPVEVYAARFETPQLTATLPASLKRATRLAIMLRPYRDRLGLRSLCVGQDPVTQDIQVLTRKGSRILWDTFDAPPAATLSDEDKIRRLLEYVRVWHSLDEPAGPYFFDNRFPTSLLRRPMK